MIDFVNWVRMLPASLWLAAVTVAVGTTGCRVVEETAKAPGKAMNAAIPGLNSTQPDPAVLQADLQRFADDFASRSIAGIDEFARIVGTEEARRQALVWKVNVSFATVSIASGPNPHASLLDFVSLAAITRAGLEQAGMMTNGPAFVTWQTASRLLETNAWRLAEGVFTPQQQQELRDAIRRWLETNPDLRNAFFLKPEDLGGVIRREARQSSRSGSVFALVGLDPTAGLDPAVREVTRTRLFAERAMYMAQRAPFLLRWQIELFADEFSRRPDTQTLLGSADRLSRAAESASQTAAQLPDRVTAERKAILKALEEQEGKLRALSAEVTRTLEAGEKMSSSLDTTFKTFDALMKRFGVGEPDASPPDTNAVPFRIQDYGQTAAQLEEAARRLTELLQTLDQTLGSTNLTKLAAEVSPIVQQAQTSGKEVVDYAFWKGILLVASALVAALIYRFFSARMNKAHSTSPTP